MRNIFARCCPIANTRCFARSFAGGCCPPGPLSIITTRTIIISMPKLLLHHLASPPHVRLCLRLRLRLFALLLPAAPHKHKPVAFPLPRKLLV